METLVAENNVTVRIANLRKRFESEPIDMMEKVTVLAPNYLVGRDAESNVVNFCDWEQWSQWSQMQ
ncbi:hypothetical protein IQ278_12000 [Tolypothrix sp. LEGE 11397]|uniref:hypothetical protein n=1 Tax=Tolypothrix sp. LEGE 11397 TaxID=2777971 RepID=UPI00188279D3|nr:hypothetical protein [Tolypothrix sp. LEGE 11397]MBE9082836.1 hypothetical protein [Tolypothrix sp. LEGE 11397]